MAAAPPPNPIPLNAGTAPLLPVGLREEVVEVFVSLPVLVVVPVGTDVAELVAVSMAVLVAVLVALPVAVVKVNG